MPAGSRIDTTNVSLGMGDLEIGEYVNDAFVAYRNAGIIRASVNINWTREIHVLETGRPLQAVAEEVIREGFTLEATLAEITVANIRMALGAGITSSGGAPTFMDGGAVAPAGDLTSSTRAVTNADILKFGGDCDLFYSALRFTHLKSCMTGKRQIVEVYKARPGGTLALSYNETEWNQFGVTFTANADTSKPRGQQYMQLVDER